MYSKFTKKNIVNIIPYKNEHEKIAVYKLNKTKQTKNAPTGLVTWATPGPNASPQLCFALKIRDKVIHTLIYILGSVG